jgi:hypothetical protein
MDRKYNYWKVCKPSWSIHTHWFVVLVPPQEWYRSRHRSRSAEPNDYIKIESERASAGLLSIITPRHVTAHEAPRRRRPGVWRLAVSPYHLKGMSWGWFLKFFNWKCSKHYGSTVQGGTYQMMITYVCEIQFFGLDKSVMTMTKD